MNNLKYVGLDASGKHLGRTSVAVHDSKVRCLCSQLSKRLLKRSGI